MLWFSNKNVDFKFIKSISEDKLSALFYILVSKY